jgi:hypothetical protein
VWSNYQDRNGSCPIHSKPSLDIDGLADDAVGHDKTCATASVFDASKNMARAIVTCRFSQRCLARFRPGVAVGVSVRPDRRRFTFSRVSENPLACFFGSCA